MLDANCALLVLFRTSALCSFLSHLCFGLVLDLRLTFPSSVPEGIDIRDQSGASIKPSHEIKGPRQRGSMPGTEYPTLAVASLVVALQSHPHGSDFLELWEQQTGPTVDSAMSQPTVTAQAGEEVIPASYYAANPSRVLPSIMMLNEKAKRNIRALLPVYPGDYMWLIHKFLESVYPQGGEIFMSNPSEDLSGNSMWTKLSAFLQEPLYRNHPYLRDIRSLTEIVRSGGTAATRASHTFKGALMVLRNATGADKSSTVRVKQGPNVGKIIGFKKSFVSATAPAGVIAPVDDPVLETVPLATTTITDEVINEEEDVEEGEELLDPEEEQAATATPSFTQPTPEEFAAARKGKRARSPGDDGGEHEPPAQRHRP